MSGFLLDTNVLSELIRPKPDPKLTQWVDATDEELLFLSVLTLGEIRKDIVLLSRGARRNALETWLRTDLQLRFFGRILNVDQGIADRWGQLAGATSTRGVSVAVFDRLLAATASQHALTLVIRNTRHVAATGAPWFNPWTNERS